MIQVFKPGLLLISCLVLIFHGVAQQPDSSLNYITDPNIHRVNTLPPKSSLIHCTKNLFLSHNTLLVSCQFVNHFLPSGLAKAEVLATFLNQPGSKRRKTFVTCFVWLLALHSINEPFQEGNNALHQN